MSTDLHWQIQGQGSDLVLLHGWGMNGAKQAIWVGWSLGGLVATHMALHHADYVSKLVTVASSPKAPLPSS